jgi:hypothetical protein
MMIKKIRLFMLIFCFLFLGCEEEQKTASIEDDMDAAAQVGASTKLSDLPELATAPASTDEMYINDGGVSKKITTANLLSKLQGDLDVDGNEIQASGTNDVVIQLADSGGTYNIIVQDSLGTTIFELDSDGHINSSDTPGISGYCAAESDTIWDITSSRDGNDDAALDFDIWEGGVLTEYVSLDGAAESIIVSKPIISSSYIEATYNDAGMPYAIINATYDMDTSDAGICAKYYDQASSTAASFTVTLPAEPRCNATAGTGKIFYFAVNDASDPEDTLTVDVNGGTDQIWLDGENCGAGDSVTCSNRDDTLMVIGFGTGGYTARQISGSTCACN